MNALPASARAVFGLLAILAITMLVYWPGLRGGYAFDDYPNIVLNKGLHVTTLALADWLKAAFSSNSSDLQRPLAMLTFAAQHYFTGLDPMPMKLVNLTIHLLNTCLVFGLVRALGTCLELKRPGTVAPDKLALFVAGFWAIAPINLMAVLFIVQRMESLSHSFVLAGLWLYVQGRGHQMLGKPGYRQVLFGLLLGTTLGLLCKESAALLPLYAALLELFVFQFRGVGESRDRRLILLFVVVLVIPATLAVIWLLPRAIGPGAFGSRDFSLAERLLTEPRVIFDYLRWCVLPSPGDMGLYHDDYPISSSLVTPPTTWMAIVAIPLLLGTAWRIRSYRPLTAIGIVWFFAAQVLTATFLPLELVFEHRNYFASLGIALAMVDLLIFVPRAPSARRIGAVAAILLIALHAGCTWIRANEWSDPLTFAIGEVARHPLSPRATYQLGQTYMILGHGDPKSPFVNAAFAAFENARKAPNSKILPAQGLLLLSAQVGRDLRDEWWNEIELKLRTRPIGPQETGALASLTDCVIADICQFPAARMYAIFNAAASHGPHPEVMNIVGNYLLNVENDSQTTLRLWRKSRDIAPKNVQYRINLAKLLIAMGSIDEARLEIDSLRGLNLFGSNESAARDLDAQLDAARKHMQDRQQQ
jgi:hypothetical protein